MENITFSKMVVEWLKKLDPRIKDKKFRIEVSKVLSSDYAEFPSGKGVNDFMENIKNFVPDAFLIDAPNKSIFIFEVEDTHPLSIEKVDHLARAWFFLDAAGWDFRVFLLDRYLSNWKVLSMVDVFYTLMTLEKGIKNQPPEKENKIDWAFVYEEILKKQKLISIRTRAREDGGTKSVRVNKQR